MDVITGPAVPPPSPFAGLLEILLQAADHHDPNTTTTHDLDALSKQAASIPMPANGFATLIGLVIQFAPAVLGLIEALKPHAKATEPVTPPVTSVPAPSTAGAPGVAATPAGQSAAALPEDVGLDVSEVFGPNRTGRNQRQFRVDDPTGPGQPYSLVMTDGDTTSLDDGSGLYLAGILMRGGQKVTIEQAPGAKDRLFWRCTHVESGESNLLTGEGASANGGASNWREDEFIRTGGFDVVLHLAKAGHYDVTFGVLDTHLEATPIRTPEVR